MSINLTLKSFREFLQTTSRLNEMSMGQSTTQSFKLPENALWLLSFMPNPQAQNSAILWLLNQGLHDASKGRKELAKIASQKLGRHVLENEIFSKAAHQEDPQLGQLYQTELKPLWVQKYEPKEMKIKEHRGKKVIEQVVSINALNKYIMNQGLPAFHFGGTEGLIEWLEDGVGKWGDRFSSGSPIHGKSSQERDGLDLSNPRFVQDDASKKSYFSFGSSEEPQLKYLPPDSDRAANELRRTMSLISGDQIRDALERQQPGKLSSSQLDWLKNNQQNLSKEQKLGLGTRTSGVGGSDEGKEVQIPEDEWDAVVGFLKRGIIEVNKTKKSSLQRLGGYEVKDKDKLDKMKTRAEMCNQPWTDEDMHIMLYGGEVEIGEPKKKYVNGLLDVENHTIRDKVNDPLWMRVIYQLARDAEEKVGSGGWNQYNQRLSTTFMDAGLKTRTPQEPIPEKSLELINYKFQNVKPQDYVLDTENELGNEVDLKDLLNNGYKIHNSVLSGPKFEILGMDEKLSKIDKEFKDGNTMSLVKGPSEYVVTEKNAGTWKIRKVISQNPTKIRKWEGAALIVHGGKFGASRKFSAPVDGVNAAKLDSQWYGNPESFADDLVNVENMSKPIPRSLKDAVRFGRNQFNNYNQNNDDALAWAKSETDEKLLGGAQEGLSQVYGSWMFKYGDPLGKWSNGKILDAENKNSIFTILAEKGINGDQAKQYIDELYKAANERRSPDFPPEIEQAFLQNGFNWRSYKGAEGVLKQLTTDYKLKGKSAPSVKGEDGEHKDIDASDDQRTSNFRNDTATTSGKIKKFSGTNTPISTNADDIIQSANEKANTGLFQKATAKMKFDVENPNLETRKTQPTININFLDDSSYNNLYQHMTTNIDSVPMNINPNEQNLIKLIDDAQAYTHSIESVITRNLSSVHGKYTSPRSRGVIDAAGDALSRKLIDIAKMPQKKIADMILASSIIERFFLNPSGNLEAIAAKHNAGKIDASDTVINYLGEVNAMFMKSVTGGLDMIRKARMSYDQKQNTPPVPVSGTPGVQSQSPSSNAVPEPQPDYSKGYQAGGDDDVVIPFTPKTQPQQPAMNQQRQAATDGRNPLAALRRPLPTTKAENYMVSFKEWKNWKLIEHLKNG